MCNLTIPFNIKCNGNINPIGVNKGRITFSFNTDSIINNQIIGGYRIVCSSSLEKLNADEFDKWDSGNVHQNICFQIEYKGEIKSAERVYYKVGVFDSNNVFSGFSKPCYFESALGDNEFIANWVEDENFDGFYAPMFAEKFTLETEEIEKARLYIVGLGFFECEINGKKTDGHILKPSVTYYDKRPLNNTLDYFENNPQTKIYYPTYDIKDLLKKDNQINVLVGSGWYYNTEKECEGNYSYNTPRMIFEIHLYYKDGKKQIIASGNNTKVKASYIISNKLYKGESWDSRKIDEKDYYTLDGYRNVKIAERPSGKLTPSDSPDDIVSNVLKGRQVSRKNNTDVYDFGENHSGVIKIKLTGKAGTKVKVVYGEHVNADGSLNHISTSWGVQIQTDEIILNGDEITFNPKFIYHGYRYAEISSDDNFKIIEVESNKLHTDITVTSYLETSDKLINNVYKIFLNTIYSNLHSGIQSDCPHREKRAFLGDGQVVSNAVLTSFDIHSFYLKWIDDIYASQDSQGYVCHTAPFSGGGGGPLYGSAIGIIPDAVYRYTMDEQCLKDSLKPLYRWIKYLDTRHDGDYLINREEFGWCLGDWFCPKQIDITPVFANTCAFMLCCKLFIKNSKILNKTNNVSEIEMLLNNIKDSFNKTYLDINTFNYLNNDNGANIFALHLDVVPEECKDIVIKNTVEYYNNNPFINTGIMGTKLIFNFLTENGAKDIAFKIFSRKEYPSYSYMLDNGATTLWECWEKDLTPDFKINDKENLKGYPVSHNHPMFGSVNEWFFRCVAGINLDELNKNLIIIKPYYIDTVEKVTAKQMTPFGSVEISYTSNKKSLMSFEVIIPTGLTAKIVLEKEYLVGSGKHKIV